MANRISRSGSVLSYTIIGVILAVGLIGAVYFLRQRGEQIRKEQAIATYEQQKSETKSEQESETKNTTTDGSVDEAFTESSDGSELSGTGVNEELPTTGISAGVSQYIGIFLLAFAITSYRKSRNLATARLL